MKRLAFIILVAVGVQTSCVSTPPLSQVTGSAQSNIMIRDVVQRVKCELSEAFDEKTKQPEFLWLASWTAHVDLTLTINDNAGISPSGSYTHFEQNAVNQAAGPSSFPPTVARGVVNQFFTVSVGAALSGQAIRTETVSFTVALDELKLWRKQLDKIESAPDFPEEKKLCNFGLGAGVTGNLGLKEWVDSAFFPAELGQLQAGIHASGATKTSSPSVPQPGPVGPKAAAPLTVGTALTDIKQWQADLADLTVYIKPASAAIDSGKTSIPNAQDAIRQKIKAASPYEYVLAPYLKERYAQVSNLIDQYSKDLTKCLTIQSLLQTNLTTADGEAAKLYDSLKDSNPNDDVSQVPGFSITLYYALRDQIRDLKTDSQGKPTTVRNGQFGMAMTTCAKIVKEATALPDKLPQQVDPPIDSVLHSLTFVISYGANVTPSWTLLQWKGPGQTANFASASGLRTHGLVISMGPRTGAPAIGNDPLRLIQLQAIRSINQQ